MVGIFLYAMLISYIVQVKLMTTLFLTVLLTLSFAASVLPTVNALTARTDFTNRHTSASFGNSHICGDHKCAPGEQTQMSMKISAAQRGGSENLKQLRNYAELHGETVMNKVAGSTSAPTTMHGNTMLTDKMNMGSNMTDIGNKTKGTK